MAIEPELFTQVKRLVINCTRKREILLIIAHRKSKLKKNLTVLSGILSLLSATTITAVLVKYVGEQSLQIFAALTAAVAGITSLLITTYFIDDEISQHFDGSSKYLSLRERTYRLVYTPNITDSELFDNLVVMQDEYASLDETYSKWTKITLKKYVKHSTAPRLTKAGQSVKKAVGKQYDKLIDKFGVTAMANNTPVDDD